MSPFELLFGRKPATTLDTLVTHIDGTELSENLDASIERCKKMLREIETRSRKDIGTNKQLDKR